MKTSAQKRIRASNSASPPSGPVVVTRRAHFNAAHRLHNPDKSAAWNRRTFGPCNHPNWHGHNYELEVSVIATPSADTGYSMDLGVLRDLIDREIVSQCDHRNLNLDVPFLKGIIPSSENLAVAFWSRLEPHLHDARLWRIRLYETPRNWVDYYGPGGPPPVA
jgi:6-pyruvoyltetrahydropterin/6-carboxytetrahydropterin synthase